MTFPREPVHELYENLEPDIKADIDITVDRLVEVKKNNGKIVVVTGSGPNLHEGVTTLIAEMIHKGLIDGVTTSSAVVAHEMAGALEKVKRVDGKMLGYTEILPRGDSFELTILDDVELKLLEKELDIDHNLISRIKELPGETIIKAAGNMAYPLGLRTERLAIEIQRIAIENDISFEKVAGAGADPRTMIGAAFQNNIPCLVTVPQLIGGGMVGIAIGDSISIRQRTKQIAEMLGTADVIIESAVALTQEIHDGPFERYTGHGIWSSWDGMETYSLKDKTIIRIDLDPNLKKAWDAERTSSQVQDAINKGLPKTKLMDIPFRMEMSGFARLEHSIPIVADIGVIWPIWAVKLEEALGLSLDFLSYPQQSLQGNRMRGWIVERVRPINKERLMKY